ncbi:histidine phosphatase family protein [Bacillus sp. V3-13]|uniref:histidine phosphatase family protein n=1 Tax=Bacillus sp. V3-13 TaxID=2053728 RepID=UPI000C7626E8|nr:histidine phosphatase family protein [Bacillus sp. V3-13]PLR77318.1 histidine phosphatase family protein [Bacillus sp. V3-13]
MDACVVVALLRHGITGANKKGAYCGWANPQLCKEGVEQLKAVKNIPNYELLVTSDLIRTKETAGILFPGKCLLEMSEFREIHFGGWEGKNHFELEKDLQYQQWLASPFTVQPPEGESFGQFTERIEKGFVQLQNKMLADGKKSAAVVTHGGVIRYLLMAYAPAEKDFWEWEIPHGSGYQLEWPVNSFGGGERCTLLRAVPLTENQRG